MERAVRHMLAIMDGTFESMFRDCLWFTLNDRRYVINASTFIAVLWGHKHKSRQELCDLINKCYRP